MGVPFFGWAAKKLFGTRNQRQVGRFLDKVASDAADWRARYPDVPAVEVQPRVLDGYVGAGYGVASEEVFTIYDLRPLRALVHQNKIKDLSDFYKKLIFQADAAMVVREGKTGSYSIVKSAIEP